MLESIQCGQASFEPFFVARQPVFDRERRILGYELFFRHCPEVGKARIRDAEVATSKVVADGYALASRGLEPDKKLGVNFPAESLLDRAALALPPERTVVEVMENVQPTPEIQAALAELRQAGYTIVLDNYCGLPSQDALRPLAHMVKIPASLDTRELVRLIQRAKQHKCAAVACRIETWDMFQKTKTMGFSMFQGHFFRRPEIVPGRKLPAAALAKTRLLQELAKEDSDVARLSDIVSSDPSLTYRLLTFINSPLFCPAATVDSVRTAISLIGLRPLKRWVMVLLLAEMDSSDRGKELRYLSLHRAFFLARLAEKAAMPLAPETMFLLGLLSKIDAMLGLPMGEALDGLPLEPELMQGLLGADNEAGAWLAALLRLEDGDWDWVHAHLAARSIPPELCAVLYLESAHLAQTAMGSL